MRKNKVLTFYSLDLFADKNCAPLSLSISVSKEDLSEYAHIWLRNQFLDVYQKWAEEEDLDWEEWSTWLVFFNTIIPDTAKEALKIRKLKFKASDVAALLRMFGSCEPIGCSYETPLEESYFNSIKRLEDIDAKYIEKLQRELDEALKTHDEQR